VAPSDYILVVDDDASIRALTASVLEDGGFTVRSAPNGSVALDVVRESAPCLVVLDLQMPEMDGRSFYRALRAAGFHTPVLLMSAHGARQAQSELGAEAAISKPFDIDDLLARTISLLK